MTDIEILLSVDAGTVPAGSTAFFIRDRTLWVRRTWAAFSAGFLAAAVAAMGIGRHEGIFPLALVSALFATLALPTLPNDASSEAKRPVFIVTPTAIILRDGHGLRTWAFDDLSGVQISRHAHRMDVILIERGGKRVFIDGHAFAAGDRLPRAIAAHLSLTTL
jgi:hypothetical protein